VEEFVEERSERSLSETQFAFIGKVLATFSHEIKNHLAIIKEYSGLIYDLIELRKSPEKDPEQYISTVKSINAQIDRTLSLISYLNRFSHRMDHQFSTFNINDTLEELFILLHRLINQKKVIIQSDFQEDLPPVCSDPFRLQLVVFGIIEGFLGRTGNEGIITAKTSSRESFVHISFQHTGDILTQSSDGTKICSIALIRNLLKEIGGDIVLDDGKHSVFISVPVSSTIKQTQPHEP
jgi:nitrogen-specific signal transduction histidine kinase